MGRRGGQGLNEYYDAKDYWTRRGLVYVSRKQEIPHEMLRQLKTGGLVELAPLTSLCEVGCAYGEALGLIRETFPDIRRLVGVDLSPTMLEEASRRLFGANVELVETDGDSLPFQDGAFDIVYTYAMFMHVPPTKVVGWMREVLRVGKIGVFHESTSPSSGTYCFFHNYQALFNELGYIFTDVLFNAATQSHRFVARRRIAS